jgi:hypothetical protein
MARAAVGLVVVVALEQTGRGSAAAVCLAAALPPDLEGPLTQEAWAAETRLGPGPEGSAVGLVDQLAGLAEVVTTPVRG